MRTNNGPGPGLMLRGLLIAAVLISWTTSPAHHAGTAFDMGQSETVTGIVKEFRFVNPHTWIMLEVEEEDGTVRDYKFEGQSVSVLARSGWTRKTLQPGDRITVNFAPYRDERVGGEFRTVTLADGTVMGMERI